MDTRELRPDEADDPAEFVDLLRRLKDRSRLTFRQLEERAAAAGDVLARSTAADVLRRSSLPRPEVLAAFVRACGAGDQVEVWLRARDRLAAGAYAATTPDGTTSADPIPAVAGSEAARRRWWPNPVPLALLVAALLALLGGGAWYRHVDEQRTAADRRDPPGGSSPVTPTGNPGPSSPPADPSAVPKGGRSQIRPARAPQLCLTEGRDRTEQYASAVAVQRPCAEATPPDTSLVPVTGGLFFIKWDHPVEGAGCLTVRDESPGRHLIEPFSWEKCVTDGPTHLFRFEPTGSVPGAYRLRPARMDLCIGIRDDATEALAEAVAEPCTSDADQVFLIDQLPTR
ncbi:helix-turn-helix domain-containing protein [Micromonospora sp. CPCC 205539]|uniref:RICIN domain-containing protein n=1 Tax=Micromonospora sp. CPCC 205539 TaxID=3122408 RepID=UPI002FF07062